VRVAVHNLEEVVGDLVEVRHRPKVERDHRAHALENAHVPVHAHVLAHGDGALGGFVLGIHPALDVHRAGAVINDVLLRRRRDVLLHDLAEQSQVVHLLAVHFERVILRRGVER
jgi:hypothetical protein